LNTKECFMSSSLSSEVSEIQQWIDSAEALLRKKGLKACVQGSEEMNAKAIRLWHDNDTEQTEICWLKTSLIHGLHCASAKKPAWDEVVAAFDAGSGWRVTSHQPKTPDTKKLYALLLTSNATARHISSVPKLSKWAGDIADAAQKYFCDNRQTKYWQNIATLIMMEGDRSTISKGMRPAYLSQIMNFLEQRGPSDLLTHVRDLFNECYGASDMSTTSQGSRRKEYLTPADLYCFND
jgi:hypothetical protein